MANNQKKKRETFTTKKGVASFPCLQVPDTKFNANGVYKVKMTFAEGKEELQAYLDEKLQLAEEEGKQKIKEGETLDVIEPYEINGEGNLVVNFKMNAKVKSRKTGETIELKPTLADGKGNVITKRIKLGSGSILKINFYADPYFTPAQKKGKRVEPAVAGVSMRLQGAQVIKLVEFGGGSMFGADEDAEYEYEEGDDEVTNTEGTEADDATEDDSEDF